MKIIKPAHRRYFFANGLHKELFFLMIFSAVLPMSIMAVGMYFLVFGVTAEQIGFPDMVAYHLLPAAKKVLVILSMVMPVVLLLIVWLVRKLTLRIVGPFDRIVRELDEHIKGKRTGHITLRKNDRLWPLVAKINLLLNRIHPSSPPPPSPDST